MAVGWFAVAMLLMLVGLFGAVLPLLPGLPRVLVGVYVYALATGLGAGQRNDSPARCHCPRVDPSYCCLTAWGILAS